MLFSILNMNFPNFDKRLVMAVGIVLVLVSSGVGFSLYQQFKSKAQPQDQADQQKVAQAEVRKLVSEVGKLIELPSGEAPTVATITDITKLQDQPFFAKAKNGDKVLIYTQAKKAILYDPSAKKILDVAPVNIGTQSAQIQSAKVVLRNGTQTTGLTTRIESELKKTIPNLNVVAKENTQKSDFEKTIVVILSDSAKDYALSLAKLLKGEVGNLPEGEVKPKDADILVILGKDRI